jgi:hypothetical protein
LRTVAHRRRCIEGSVALAAAVPDMPRLSGGLLDRAGSAVTALLRRALELYRNGDNAVPLVDLVRTALRGASRHRCHAITDAIAPIIAELGGSEAVVGCLDAIRDIQRWYP